ncbi:DNA ligase LigA-related protein [Janthinobacterium sp. CG3]|uniref:DNA ligase LigA-related protein n=1 Tax=Janthinobacterium sp. CG3 TaxID=1075768 RepID=UPI000382D1BE|nr:hypothetical protein [Janthinobacterium sp. CG3]
MYVELIRRRRTQMLIHSYAYYVLDTPMISDDVWQRWADELVALQGAHSRKNGHYDRAFEDWDGSTGMHLPKDEWVRAKTRQVLALYAMPDVAMAAAPLPPLTRPAAPAQGSLF